MHDIRCLFQRTDPARRSDAEEGELVCIGREWSICFVADVNLSCPVYLEQRMVQDDVLDAAFGRYCPDLDFELVAAKAHR